MKYGLVIDEYLRGPGILREAMSGMTAEQLRARPNQGQWSTREVIFHVVDFDMMYAHYMKRVLVEDRPEISDVASDISRLMYSARNVNHEAWLLKGIRRHMGAILRSVDADDFERVGMHAADGPLTLATLLRRATDHIPYHVQLIKENRIALRLDTLNIPLRSGAADIY